MNGLPKYGYSIYSGKRFWLLPRQSDCMDTWVGVTIFEEIRFIGRFVGLDWLTSYLPKVVQM